MNRPEWRFRRMHPGEMNVDPIEGEFFSTEALDSLADALVREAIQNSLDARRPGECLRMRFAFSGADDALDADRTGAWLTGLMPHLRAARSGVADLPADGAALSFLTVEDFGTRGLQGDPLQSEDGELDETRERNDFYYFWRNIGRSRKSATDLGRWGLGKTVFPAASRINSFFAFTVRHDDGRRLLLGQSVARVHRIGDRRHYPYGYFGLFEGDFAMPVEGCQVLERFTEDFALARGDDAGLSVAIPFPSPEITPDAIVPSILRHYFLAIMDGALRVEVVEGGSTRTLDEATLPELAARHHAPRGRTLGGLFELAQWMLRKAPGERVELDAPPEREAPRWADERVSPEQVGALREKLESGRPLAVRVPVRVKPAAGEPVLSHFDLVLQRDDALDRAEEHFVREYITVTGVRGGLPRGYRCILAVHDRPLATLLGDSENPAHTEWQERSPLFRDRYRHGPFTLRYVRNAPRELLRLLTRPAEGRDHSLLRELFSLELDAAEQALDSTPADAPGNGESAGPDAPAGPGGREAGFRLDRLPGGFRITGAAEDNAPPAAIVVEVAYEVRRGNPFAQYQSFDFELDRAPISVLAANAELDELGGNRLLLRPKGPDFGLVVTGFHVARDLRVRARSVVG